MMTLPKFLLKKKFMMESVVFVFVFSVIYMFLYKPFSATVWFGFSSWRLALLTISYYAVAISVMIGSKFVLVAIQKRRDITAPAYALLVLVEFAILTFFYILFTVVFKITEVHLTFWLVCKTMGCTALILAIPYTFIVMHTANRGLRDENQMLRAQLATAKTTKRGGRLIDLYDTFGTMKLSIEEDSIYYIESQDNYVKIFYELDGELVNYMLRCRTQKMEEMLEGTAIHRCHRSYFVNFSKIQYLDRGSKRAFITLSHPDVKPVPVSKTYYRTVISANLVEKPRI